MSTVHIFGTDVPVWDYLTGHEWERVEELLADPPTSALRADLMVFAIFAESRAGTTLDVDALLEKPVPGDELSAAVESLTAPFVIARRKRAERQFKTQASLLTPTKLQERRTELQANLAVIERLLSESSGGASEPS